MLINPHTAIKEGWITGITDPDSQIQPNAIDFTLDHLYTIDSSKTFSISNDAKEMRGGEPVEVGHNDFWAIQPNQVYDGMSGMSVDLPEGIACTLIIRSTYNRNGIFLSSGLYDSGYKGPIGFAIHNRSGLAFIKQGTRIGQIMFQPSDSAGVYAGGYNREANAHWSTVI